MTPISLGIVGVLVYIAAVILGPIIIEYFKRLSVKQVVREEGLESHKKKTGTPMMGGFIFLIPALSISLIALLLLGHMEVKIIVMIAATIAYGYIGFIDDYRKVIKKHNEGLKSREKLIGQLLIGLPLAIYATSISSEIWIPFTSTFVELGWFKAVVVLFIVLATTNAVNLTDGVDGLSSSVTILVLMFYVFVGVKLSEIGISIYAISIMGGLFGFLMYNKNPAKIFMGDIGSLALGGAVVSLSIFTNTLLLIPLVGVIYFIETLSVTIQVLYFKKTGKRVFKMTPIHHHFELSGWHENKIVRSFSIVTIVGVVIGILSMIPRF
ncbi:MAG: phospho-N-acetylmuramoyl-pentapeptide-transferase [Clostridiales bacterium]|nr:phospho-N-acetylmuramoyl-pentapeptide-transferase [Clostridiales bacterium]